jgi:hypothetical protein
MDAGEITNGKTKAIIVKESDVYKNWGIDQNAGLKIPEQLIIKRQTIIDSFEIIRGFPTKDQKAYERRMKDEKECPEICIPVLDATIYIEKKNKYNKKKRKKYKKLWHNTILLKQYSGEINIDLNYISQRRVIQLFWLLLFEGKNCLYSETDIKILIEEANHFIGLREVFSISSIKERKQKLLRRQKLEAEDLRCHAQAFENNSSLGEPGLAAETVVGSKILNDRQKPVTECTFDSVYLKTCLESEIDPMFLIEEQAEEVFIIISKSSINSSSINFQNRSFEDK